ncbi:MAG: EAL domain-containing protein [Alphaproteobacteria bacterium]|nr:EAL domain-containing protein [Alphaproteobacteria bacterium]
MPILNADSAVHAAGAAVWTWHGADGRLSIRAETGGPLSSLDGGWRIAAFLEQIDGLTRSLVAAQLNSGSAGDPVDARIMLIDGRRAHFVGSFYDRDMARGLIVTSEGLGPRPSAETNVEPVFQPIRRLDDLSVAGFEALARFRAPDGRLVGAETLVGLGGDTDWTAIAPVMLRKSAETLSALRSEGRTPFMQVNLSAAEIARPLLVEEIAAIIREARLPPGHLRVELTEQAALRDFEGALGALAAFRAAGAGIVLDDFGAGHSSFAWLAEIPADGVKLDPKLIRMVSQPRARRILAALAALIRDLGMTVTAEGIEDPATAPDLRAMGCDFVQGYAYDLPMLAGDMTAAYDPLAIPPA